MGSVGFPSRGRPYSFFSLRQTAKTVLEEIRRVACERVDGMGVDTPITELGMDSLERTGIVASLEERFGGRFPEVVLPELTTVSQVAEAVRRWSMTIGMARNTMTAVAIG